MGTTSTVTDHKRTCLLPVSILAYAKMATNTGTAVGDLHILIHTSAYTVHVYTHLL